MPTPRLTGGTATGEGAGDSQAILVTGSPWRWHITVRKAVVPVEALRAPGIPAAEPALLPIKLAWNSTPDPTAIETEPPPAMWREADFDDGDWPRSMGPFEPGVSIGLLCLRGRFTVTDPAAVKALNLSMTYRGGVVVYLNGVEVLRRHVPAGPITPATPAEAYPDEAYLDADGKALPHPRRVTPETKARYAARDRRLDPVSLSTEALRKGVNVLAVEVHRSDYHPVGLTWWNTSDYAYGREWHWAPVGVLDVRLTAAGSPSSAGTGAAPNLERPSGFQFWNLDIHERPELTDYGDPNEGLQPIRIVGARSGVHSGAVVASSADALKGVRAAVGDLVAADGDARIPASAVQVRYALPGSEALSLGGAFDPLVAAPPAEVAPTNRIGWQMARRRPELGLAAQPVAGAVLPIWVTVHVPADAPAGQYRGEVALTAEGFKQRLVVPLHLHVADWTVPAPQDFRTHVGIFQSPTTLAMHYKVPEWSEAHWQLMERSFQLLGEVGNNLVNIPISDRTQFGNDEGMVYFVRKADGTFDYDFTVFDRYLALVKKHLGRPRFVALHVWHAGAWQPRKADQENTVTVVDPQTGARERMQVPVFGTEESSRFWQPVLLAAREHLAAAGMAESMCIGVLSDGTAPPEVFTMFSRIMPGLGWTRGCHSVTMAREPYGLPGGAKVVYHEFCYGGGVADAGKLVPEIWAMNGPGTDWRRGWRDAFPPITFRRLAERALYAQTRGFGRLGLDFWPVEVQTPAGRTVRQEIFNRWPHSTVAGHGDPTIIGLAHPGPDGPTLTTRLLLVREGIQEAEAMIAVAEALQKHADALGPDLAAECRRIFVDRITACRVNEAVDNRFFTGWQERSRQLYGAAAKVAAVLKTRSPGAG